jgi:DNA-binding CsgD family transcriptional regulator/PAS domain-containing protein
LDEVRLSSLLGLLYDAASDHTLWTPFLESLAEHIGGHAAALVMHQSGVRSIALNAGMSTESVDLYADYYHAVDTWAIRGTAQTTAGWVGASEELSRWEEFRNTEFYNDFTFPAANIGHGIFALVSKEQDRFMNLSVYRPPEWEPFGPNEVGILKLLGPHLRRAYRLHFQLSSLRGRSRSFDILLDSLPQGVILLGAGGNIIYMNRAAGQLCEVHDGLLATSAGLAAESPVESANLQSLVSSAVSTSLGEGLGAGGGLQISRKSAVPLNVVVSPVRGLPTDFSETVRAVVYVIDPTLRVRPRNELLQAIFNLTPAECRIALLIADGVATSDIREMVGITANTLRTHLASIYRKTNTERQAQLVKVLNLIAAAG